MTDGMLESMVKEAAGIIGGFNFFGYSGLISMIEIDRPSISDHETKDCFGISDK